MNRVSSLLWLALSLFAFLAPALRGEEAPSGPVIELPKFVVTDNRELPPPESWRYGTIPGFEILSNAAEKPTQRLINDFEKFRLGLSYVWPMPNRPTQPVSLIICGRGAKFDAFVPKEKDAGPEMARVSLFLKQGDKTAIVLDFQSKVLNLLATETDDPASGTDTSQLSVDHEKQLNREYLRYLLSQAEPRLPAWFEEGLTQIIMRMTVEPDLIEFGRLEDPNLVSAQAAQIAELNALATASDPDSPLLGGAPAEDRDFNAALRRRPLMSFPKFLAVGHDDPIAVNPLGNNIWAKQAYAFVHMCLFGRGGRYKKGFSQFLLRSTREPVTEAMFKECFRIPKGKGFEEMSFRDMLIELRGYCEMSDYKLQGFKPAKGEKIPMPAMITLRDATQSEVGRIKGEALILAGNKERARNELIAPYIRGERDPNLLASLGLFDRANGEDARARKLLEGAAAGKTTRPEAYIELARYRYADALAKPDGAGGKFSDAQVAGIIDLLLAARRQSPPIVTEYEMMADTWLRRNAKVKPEEIGTLVDGIRMFPGRMKLAFQIGTLAFDAGLNDLAHAMADHGLKYSPDAQTKSRFEQLKAALPPAPPAAAPTGTSAAPASGAAPGVK
jgi:hypothetical protein